MSAVDTEVRGIAFVMKIQRAGTAALALVLAAATPGLARDSFVQDGASMFAPATVASVNQRIQNFSSQTGKEIVVVTVASVPGGTLNDVHTAAQQAFAQQAVNGVLIYIDKGDRKDYIVPDAAGQRAGWFTAPTLTSIRTSMESEFRQGNFDAGLTAAVGGTLDVYRSHMGSLNGGNVANGAARSGYGAAGGAGGGVHFNMFWIIVFVVIGFLILRSIMRASRGPRYGPGQMGGPPMGGPMGGGYGYGGGGGFFSGLLGGLGGAWLGNQMFDRDGGGGSGGGDTGAGGAWGGGGPGGQADAGGWQSDGGQAGIGSGGDFGGGGFGDSGGGFGDSGGGGGDSGGGGW